MRTGKCPSQRPSRPSAEDEGKDGRPHEQESFRTENPQKTSHLTKQEISQSIPCLTQFPFYMLDSTT